MKKFILSVALTVCCCKQSNLKKLIDLSEQLKQVPQQQVLVERIELGLH